MYRFLFGESSAASAIGTLAILAAGIGLVWVGLADLQVYARPVPGVIEPTDIAQFPARAMAAVVLGLILMVWGLFPIAQKVRAYFAD